MLTATPQSLYGDMFTSFSAGLAPETELTGQAWKARPLGYAARFEGLSEPAHLRILSDAIIAAVNGTGPNRLIVTMPPRHGKSETVSKWTPLWLLDHYPHKKIVITSYEATFAASWSSAVRDLAIQHEAVLNFRVRRDSRAGHTWRTTAGGIMHSAGARGSLTGRGADFLIVDDPIKNREEADSKTIRDRIWSWWVSTARSRLEPGAIVIIVMTRWHEDDLVGRLLERDAEGQGEGWQLINFPALAQSSDDPLVQDGVRGIDEAIWEERFSTEHYRRMRQTTDGYEWQSLYQQNPTSPAGSIIRRAWWALGRNRFDNADRSISNRCVARYLSYDTAMSKEDGSAYSVGMMAELTEDYRLFIREVWRERLQFPELTSRVVADIRRHNRDGKLYEVLIEDASSGTSLFQTILSTAPEELVADPAGLHPPFEIVPIRPVGPKPVRLRRASVWVRNCSVWLPQPGENVAWLHAFEEELYAAPTGTYWDQADTFSQLVNHLEDDLSEGWIARGAPTISLEDELVAA